MDRGRSVEKEKHPRETTNIISKFSFFYIIALFKKGYTKGLEYDDVYDVLNTCRSNELGNRLEQEWQKEKTKHKKPLLFRPLLFCFGKTFITLGVIQLVVKLIITVWSPHARSKLISYFSPDQTDLTKSDAINFACIVIGLNVFSILFFHNFRLYVLALGLGVKAAVSSLLYRKSLKLNCETLSQVTVGKITTVINRDVEIFQQFVSQGNDMWIALVQTFMICYLVYNKIGIASWAGITFFFVVLPLQMYIGKLAYNYRLKCSIKTDERLEITQEVLSAIKIIKMYTWEKYFERKICDARKAELQKLHKLFYSRVLINVIGRICSRSAFFIFLMTYVWMDNTVTAETVYYILSCFEDLQTSLSNSIPSGFSKAAEVYAVIKRCEKVLNCEEMPLKCETSEIVCPQIVLSNVSVKVCGRTVLDKISIDINQGLNIVVGPVGAGKSTLLKAIMQDCEMSGNVRVLGSISYASEEPWLFPSSIKNNILFGEEYCEKRYEEILKICSLDYDLELIDGGDSTVVGDRGVNLSKGQQTRVNLARALYKNSDIYLLDDSLASLDAHVSDHIFKECIQKFLKNKICVFVTNNLDYIQEADNIIMVDDDSFSCSHNFDKKKLIDSGEYLIDNIKTEELVARAPVYHEIKNPGKVSLADYYNYVSYGGGVITFCLIMALFTAYQGASSYSEKLLSNWVTLEQNVSTLKTINLTNTPEYEQIYEERTNSLTLYSAMFAIAIVLYLVSIFTYFFFIKTASKNLHKAMLKTIMNATMKFFDNNFIGNVLTRFSKDCVTVDEYLPFVLIECLLMIFVVSGGVILLTSVNIIFLVGFFILLGVAYLIKHYCQPTGRNLQRLHVMARCPMVGHVNSSLTGLSTIRASNAQDMIIKEFDRYQDQFTSAHYMLDNSLIALSFSLELFSALFITSIIVQFLATDFGPSVGDVGLAINQAFAISEIISNGIRVIADTENLMTSVERILEYVRLEQEDKHGSFIDHWPTTGAIDFANISLNYGGKKDMLKDISFKINPKENLGIVGRTGAGKSSIISSLLRLYQINGTVTIDGIDTKIVSLKCLRSSISVIPQDPFLFSGTIRDNLDPLNKYTDDQIWQVLSELRLKQVIGDLGLVVDKGSTLSSGQKQLLCLARVILRKNKIIILDEATANVDQETDRMIHDAVWKNFAESTVITIAHRLLSVLDCDRVIVMKNGQVSECDQPQIMLQNKSSFFHSIVK
ncbi:probable multidrug resistance-associated protein lethal(2)03659 [Zophobas morio]|uniref:probable multidrug resistance-associated protein lethal(2)03659 n=1 Tax=Zophobas morio TaxID=2755281 RepID=UPI003083954E